MQPETVLSCAKGNPSQDEQVAILAGRFQISSQSSGISPPGLRLTIISSGYSMSSLSPRLHHCLLGALAGTEQILDKGQNGISSRSSRGNGK
jgi:hypothetical protein